MKAKLEPASFSDLEFLVQLDEEVRSPLLTSFNSPEEVKEYLTNSHVYLIHLDDQIVGCISYEDKGKNTAYFDGIAIGKQHQRKGIATNAFKKLLQIIEDNQFTHVYLHTHPHNTPALLLYLKNGFHIKGWIDNFHNTGQPRLKLEKDIK